MDKSLLIGKLCTIRKVKPNPSVKADSKGGYYALLTDGAHCAEYWVADQPAVGAEATIDAFASNQTGELLYNVVLF